MMPGIGFEEMVIFVLVAIVVIGPKDLPLMMRKFGRFTGKMRALAFDFKQGIDELGRQAELDELRKEVASLKKHTGLDELQQDMRDDAYNLQRDVDSSLAPLEPPRPTHPALAAATPATDGATPATEGAETPPIPEHAGLSADHPGYDAGDDFRIDGYAPEPAPMPAAEPALPAPQPVKQDSPA